MALQMSVKSTDDPVQKKKRERKKDRTKKKERKKKETKQNKKVQMLIKNT